MPTGLAAILATAILSSLLTLVLGVLFLRPLIRRLFDEGMREAIRRLNAEVGPEIENRVKQGVKEGIKSIPTREVLKETTLNMARTGAEIVNEGIRPFLRPRPRRKESDMLNTDDFDDPV